MLFRGIYSDGRGNDPSDLLYRNNGDSTLTRVLTGPIVNEDGDARAGAWGDIENDGDGSFSRTTLAVQATGSPTEAVRFLEPAEAHPQQLLDGNPDRLSEGWHDVAILEVALREARDAIGGSHKP